MAQDAEDGRLATVLRYAASAHIRRDHGMDDAPVLPALDQVTGWSRADPDAVAGGAADAWAEGAGATAAEGGE